MRGSIIESTDKLNKLNMKVETALGKVSDVGIDAVEALLNTDAGKAVIKQIGKHYLKKYWWAVATIGALDLIGIFAIMKFTLSKKD